MKKPKPLKVIWHKTKFGEEASYGEHWGKVHYTWDLDDNKMGYAFFNSNNRVVTPKFKTRVQAKKAAEKWLTESQRDSNGTSSKSHKEQK